ncbi:MAG: bifunctional hydroxymethylpyrimidine kinase/phosphomethylpyrimidine kinase [Bacteroidota bacterium]
MPSPPHVIAINALYTGSDRGLAADLQAGRRLGLHVHTVCSAIVVASHGTVTDVTDVPADTVSAQLEHLTAAIPWAGVRVGILGDRRTVETVFNHLDAYDGPVVLDFTASGPYGETVLTQRGIDALSERMKRADLVLIRRADAELVTGGEIRSLDDAQVAAQRAFHRGARRVVIKCGDLPARFYDAADDPEARSTGFTSDLYYDGEDFALYEAPTIEHQADGASSVHSMAVLAAVIGGHTLEEALQQAKRSATDALRYSADSGFEQVLSYAQALRHS